MSAILHGDAIEKLREMPEGSVNTCITSPPYFGLRDYGKEGQIGLERAPQEYVEKLVDVFREVRRVLRDDGTLWLNLGDSYNNGHTGGNGATGGLHKSRLAGKMPPPGTTPTKRGTDPELKRKDLIGIPWRVAFALQADGWYLRQDIIWNKPNAMPESVRDRCTKGHEYIFLLSKSPEYYFDADAIREPWVQRPNDLKRASEGHAGYHGKHEKGANGNIKGQPVGDPSKGRNKRTVWTVSTKPYAGAHFATFPMDLIEPCVLAGSPRGGMVLDPFFGSGTTGAVAIKNGREYTGIELNEEYIALARKRLENIPPTLL